MSCAPEISVENPLRKLLGLVPHCLSYLCPAGIGEKVLPSQVAEDTAHISGNSWKSFHNVDAHRVPQPFSCAVDTKKEIQECETSHLHLLSCCALHAVNLLCLMLGSRLRFPALTHSFCVRPP